MEGKMDEVKLLLVDDHEVVRTGLRMLLENQPNIKIVGEANTGLQALAMADALDLDVVIMDITLPDISGIEATRRLKQAHPDLPVVALTIHEDEQYFFEMLQAGASGYVPKRAAPEDLLNAIQAVHAGEVYIYPTLAKLLVADFISRAGEGFIKATVDGLTPREQEVLSVLADGLS